MTEMRYLLNKGVPLLWAIKWIAYVNYNIGFKLNYSVGSRVLVEVAFSEEYHDLFCT